MPKSYQQSVENEGRHKSMLLSEDLIEKGLFPHEPGSQCGMIHNDHVATPQK
jgi:hypothetical protein